MFIITVAVRTCTNVVDKLVHVRVEKCTERQILHLSG